MATTIQKTKRLWDKTKRVTIELEVPGKAWAKFLTLYQKAGYRTPGEYFSICVSQELDNLFNQKSELSRAFLEGNKETA